MLFRSEERVLKSAGTSPSGLQMNLGLGNRINDDSRKGAKGAKFGEIGKYFSLRSWRIGAMRRRSDKE